LFVLSLTYCTLADHEIVIMLRHPASLEEDGQRRPSDSNGDRAAEQQASSENLLGPAADTSKEGSSSHQEDSAATDTATLLDGWPRKPQKLGEITAFTVLSFVADAVLVLAPVTFIGKLPTHSRTCRMTCVGFLRLRCC
jgi:hypothetical protein